MIKKLFSLALTVLASFNLWADATHTAPATVSYAEKTFLDVANTPGNAGTDNEEYLTYGVQVMNNNYSSWAWFDISSGAWSKSNNAYSLPSEATGFCPAGSSSSSEFYGQINFKANDNSKTGQIDMYVTGLTEVGFVWKNNNTSSNRWMNYSVTEVASDGTLGTPRLKNGSTSSTSTQYDSIQGLDGEKYYKISMWTEGGSSSLVYTFTFKRYTGPSCTDPEAHLAFTKSTAYVGEQFSYNFGSKSGGDLNDSYTLNGAPAVQGTDYTFTSGNITVLKAGQFVMLMTVGARDGYCAADLSDTILINEATPVDEVTVDGPTAAYVGEAVTFTATAENASDYAWTVNGVDANTNAAEFTFTPAAAGEYSIVCSARNKFNAANEWIASEAKVLTASNVSGELLKVTVTGGKTATVTGIFGGTADINVGTGDKSESDFEGQHGYKLNSNGYYVGVHSLEHALAEGDTAIVYITTASANLQLFSDKGTTKIGELIGGVQQGANKVILNSNAAGAKAIYLYRADIEGGGSSMNPYVAYISVIRPKAVDHADVSLVGATINGEALPSDFVTHLINEGTFTILDSYVNAPVVAFVKHTDTYYEGETEPVSTNDSIKVTATEVEGEWQAQATIGENTYTINMKKAASFTVHYMDGENELGTENVAANDTVAKYADYQSKTLATFVKWYQDVDLTIEYILTAPVTAETYLYAKFENVYATSINIEQAVLDNGKGEAKSKALLSQLGTLNYASNITYSEKNNELDSLNNAKDIRNYDYLGLKVKASGAMLDFRLAAGKTVKVKFGKVSTTPKVAINGGAKADMTLVDAANGCKTYTYTAEEDTYISISTADGAAVVFKQIMIDEELKEVVLPALYTVTYNAGDGTCAVEKAETQFAGDKVVLPAATPAENYEFDGWYDAATGGTKVGVAGAEYAPTANITLYAYYTPAGGGSAINNTDAAVKTVKVIRNGQLIIIRDGKEFNVLGAAVK